MQGLCCWSWKRSNVSKTAFHGGRWVHAVETISNQSLKMCICFPFEQKFPSRKQDNRHHTLLTSWTTTVRQENFVLHPWLSSVNRQCRLQPVTAVSVTSFQIYGVTFHRLYWPMGPSGGTLRNIYLKCCIVTSRSFTATTNSLLHIACNKFNWLTNLLES